MGRFDIRFLKRNIGSMQKVFSGNKSRRSSQGTSSSSSPQHQSEEDSNKKSISNAITLAKVTKLLANESNEDSNGGLQNDEIAQITKKAVDHFDTLSPDRQHSYLEYAKSKHASLTPRPTLHGEEVDFVSNHVSGKGELDGKLRRTGSRKGAWFVSYHGAIGGGNVNVGSMLRLTEKNGRPEIETEPVAIKTIDYHAAVYHQSNIGRKVNDLQSPYLIKYYGTHLLEFKDGSHKQRAENKLVMEFAPYGTALGLAIKIKASKLSQEQKSALMRTMICHVMRGVKAMHDAGMTHNDIKGLNVLLGKDGNMKLVDFGISSESKLLPIVGKAKYIENPSLAYEAKKRDDMAWLKFYIKELTDAIKINDPHLSDICDLLRGNSEGLLNQDVGELLEHQYFKQPMLSSEAMLGLLKAERIISEPETPSLSSSLFELGKKRRATDSMSDAASSSRVKDYSQKSTRAIFKNLADVDLNRLDSLSAYSPTLKKLIASLGSFYPNGIEIYRTEGEPSIEFLAGNEPRLLITSPSEQLFPELLLDGIANANMERAMNQTKMDAQNGKFEVLADHASPGSDKLAIHTEAEKMFAETMIDAKFEQFCLLRNIKNELDDNLKDEFIVTEYLSKKLGTFFGVDQNVDLHETRPQKHGKGVMEATSSRKASSVSETIADSKKRWITDNSENISKYKLEYNKLRPVNYTLNDALKYTTSAGEPK